MVMFGVKNDRLQPPPPNRSLGFRPTVNGVDRSVGASVWTLGREAGGFYSRSVLPLPLCTVCLKGGFDSEQQSKIEGASIWPPQIEAPSILTQDMSSRRKIKKGDKTPPTVSRSSQVVFNPIHLNKQNTRHVFILATAQCFSISEQCIGFPAIEESSPRICILCKKSQWTRNWDVWF